MKVEFSVVIPVYNEEESLKKLYEKLGNVLARFYGSNEIIFVDDGSQDNSFSVLQKLHKQHANVKVIQFRRNFGKAAALSAGFQVARGNIIITLDADLQDDPEDIPNFLAKLEEGYDLVSGWKHIRHDPIKKIVASKLFNLTVRLLSGVKIHDFNCGFKMYRSDVIKELNIYGELHRFIPALVHSRGFSVTEIKVHHHAREFGKSKYGLERIFRGFLDFFTVSFLIRYMRRPLHLFGGLGLVFSLAGFAINLYITYLRITLGNIGGRLPLLLLGILLLVLGFQFFSTGLLGDILAGTNKDSKSEYSIKRRLG